MDIIFVVELLFFGVSRLSVQRGYGGIGGNTLSRTLNMTSGLELTCQQCFQGGKKCAVADGGDQRE